MTITPLLPFPDRTSRRHFTREKDLEKDSLTGREEARHSLAGREEARDSLAGCEEVSLVILLLLS